MARSLYYVEGPDSESYTQVYVILLQPNGSGMYNVPGYAKMLDLPQYVSGGYFGNVVSDEGFKAYSNISGYMAWSLIQGPRYKFTVPYIDLEKTVTLTATGLVSLGAL